MYLHSYKPKTPKFINNKPINMPKFIIPNTSVTVINPCVRPTLDSICVQSAFAVYAVERAHLAIVGL